MKIKIFEKLIWHHFNKKQNYYTSEGYKITYDNNIFNIVYNKSIYSLQLKTYHKRIYLVLTPYSSSYFKTKLTLKGLNFKVDLTLFAIKENEQMLKNATNIKSKKKIKKDIDK